MISAVLATLLGVLSWLGGPIVLPVFALALGANAIIKERRSDVRRPAQVLLGGIGAFTGGLAILVILFQQYA